MFSDSLSMEHYRLHVIEQWPEGRIKQAALTAVRSTIEGLLRRDPATGAGWTCITCSAPMAPPPAAEMSQ
jgi:hypothetical protein